MPKMKTQVAHAHATTLDSLAVTAMVGTSQRPPEAHTDEPAAALVAAAGVTDPERQLLLNAGTLAIYRQAGQVARTIPFAEPHTLETLGVCPPRAAHLIEQLFANEYADLLPEALARLHTRGWRLPQNLLIRALDRPNAVDREALLPVLGERGRWLAQFNQDWAWATEATSGDGLPPDAEAIWHEGKAAQRVALLRRLRASDPAMARAWLEAAWKRETASLRWEFLETFAIGLAPEDEPLLERALDDRSEQVRAIAVELLGDLQSSAFVGRMRERVEKLLTYANGTLALDDSVSFEPAWQRDGMARTSNDMSDAQWWVIQALAHVDPAHWSRHFDASPRALLAAFERWEPAQLVVKVGEALTTAASRFHNPDWCLELWDFWLRWWDAADVGAQMKPHKLLAKLLPGLPADALERFALARMADLEAREGPELEVILAALPRPWSDAVSAAVLAGWRDHVELLSSPKRDTAKKAERSFMSWRAVSAIAAPALPSSAFAAALEPLPIPDGPDAVLPNPLTRTAHKTFTDAIRLRKRILKEIPL